MKQNLVVLLADIFNLFEIHPAPCVDYPESEQASGEFLIKHFMRVNCGLCHFKNCSQSTHPRFASYQKAFVQNSKNKKFRICLFKIGEEFFRWLHDAREEMSHVLNITQYLSPKTSFIFCSRDKQAYS